MPVISMFYGLIISMYFIDRKRHRRPHIHVRYQGGQAVFAITDGRQLEGDIPWNKVRLVQG